jgi:phosphoribosylaminoimidazole carboxylase PurE protein
MNGTPPKVGIILGSASDIPFAKTISETLELFGVGHEVTVSSAHRTPDATVRYAGNAMSRGIGVLICVAGLSAALPGVVAAHTPLPVLGVPVPAGSLGGLDALLSVAQMPPGVPVASLGIGGAKNAALLALRILSLEDERLLAKLTKWTENEAEKVARSRASIEDLPSAPEDAFL